jgi:hypothetical protein
MKKKIFIILLVFISFAIYSSYLIIRHKSNYEIYRQYIKWESLYFDLIHRNYPLKVSDTTLNLENMDAYGKEGNLLSQNPDSLYYEIRKAFPNIELTTIYDFYNKNKVKSAINTEELACSIKTRYILTFFSQSTDTIDLHFSRLGFNKDKSKAMVYVYSDEKNYSAENILFYKKKFGLWYKESEIKVSSRLYFPKINGEVPPPPF